MAIVYGARKSHLVAARSLHHALTERGLVCDIMVLPKGARDADRDRIIAGLTRDPPALIATGGTEATSLVLERVPDVPVVFFMVPNALDAPFMKSGSVSHRRLAGVAADVSPSEQLTWIRSLDPSAERFGVPYGRRSAQTVAALAREGWALGITIVPIEARRTDFAAAIDALNDNGCDSALMIPDGSVYNVPTVQRLLLWGLRRKRPVWAFSDNIVGAGALAGQSCDAAAVGRQAARIVLRIRQNTPVASIGMQYPQETRKAVNTRTAEMIDVPLDPNGMDPAIRLHTGKR